MVLSHQLMRSLIRYYDQFKELLRNLSLSLSLSLSIEISKRPCIFGVICFSEQKLLSTRQKSANDK